MYSLLIGVGSVCPRYLVLDGLLQRARLPPVQFKNQYSVGVKIALQTLKCLLFSPARVEGWRKQADAFHPPLSVLP